MHKDDTSGLVPEQQRGKAIDTEEQAELENEEQASQCFERAKDRLADVNRWKQLASMLSASFQLVDKDGLEVDRTVQEGDYFKIDIPGPDNKNGSDYDWVMVEAIENTSTEHREIYGIRVRPASPPQRDALPTSHFYSDETTSSFVVKREGNKVTAGVYDRNARPNTDADTTAGAVRDKLVGLLGLASFSKLQWKALTTGLLSND